MKEITKAQEEILKALWKINEGAVLDVIQVLPEPKPAYNTVATVIKVLENKGFVDHKVYGKTYVYFPVITQTEYADFIFKDSVKDLFGNSLNNFVSFFIKQNNVSLNELDELKKMIDEVAKTKENDCNE